MRRLRTLRELLKDENGGPLVEFAVIAMFVALTLPPLMDISTLIHAHTQLAGGMRAGAQYALTYPTDSAGIQQAVQAASELDTAVVTSEQFCECNYAVTACTSSCAAGVTLKRYTRIVASYDMSDAYNIDLYPDTISKTVTVRTQ